MKQLFKDKKYWKEMGYILLFGIAINIACFCMPMVAHCETINSVLPYLCQNDNSFYSEEGVQNALSLINEKYPSDDIYNKKFFVCYGVYNVWYTWGDYIEVPAYYVYTCPDNMILPTTWSSTSTFENFQFNDSSCYIDVSLGNYDKYIVAPQSIQENGYNISKFGGGTVRLFGEVTTHNISNRYFEVTVPGLNYPVYTTSQFTTVDRSANEGYILAFADTIIDVGEFTELPPLDEILNNINSSYTPHSNDTPPTYDNTLTDGQNISNAINGHSTNMNNAINNLGQNLQNFFNKLYEKLTNTGNKISQNIYNGFSTLMQNIKDFFGPKIDDLIEKVGQLVDHFSQQDTQQDVNDALDNTTMHQDLSSLHTLVSDSLAIWSNTDAPQEFKIPFHLEELPMFNVDKCQYIDVGLFSPVFPYLRGIMWCFLVYSVIYTVIDSIANYIGGGDE